MMSTLNKVIIFATGAVIGSLVAWRLTKTKYEKIMIEEEQSLREYYNKKVKVIEDTATDLHDSYQHREDELRKKLEEETEKEPEIVQDTNEVDNKVFFDRYTEILKGYTSSQEEQRLNENTNENTNDKPYVVSPDEFGDADDYDIITLNYYADGVVADDWNDPIEDIGATIGEDFASHYGEYEEDVVYVRNDRLKVEYEILRSNLRYEDMVKDDGDE